MFQFHMFIQSLCTKQLFTLIAVYCFNKWMTFCVDWGSVSSKIFYHIHHMAPYGVFFVLCLLAWFQNKLLFTNTTWIFTIVRFSYIFSWRLKFPTSRMLKSHKSQLNILVLTLSCTLLMCIFKAWRLFNTAVHWSQ